MTVDWRLNKLQREAQGLRERLDHLNRTIEGLGAMLEEARSFEGYFGKKIADAERRLFEVSPKYLPDAPVVINWPSAADQVEAERLRAEIGTIEREREEERARRTTTGSDGFRTLTFCALRSHDVITRRGQIIIARDQIARELADVESQMTPGEIVQSGIPAGEYVEHRERVQALRQSSSWRAS